MLTDLLNKIKSFLSANQHDLYLAALVFVMSVASFGLGRLSAVWPVKESIVIEEPSGLSELSKSSELSQGGAAGLNLLNSLNSPNQLGGNFVASKNGSAYHLPDCPGAKQIKEENKIWFPSATDAKAAGYKPAGNCPGL
ncbi:MAG: Ada metal-binding domain-containing protein [bacterium]|nr:Ada metal-binding domain-containing protein [bacterium]